MFILRIELHDVEPTVWRSVSVHDDTPLPVLAHVIEAAMGWESDHLHGFRVGHIGFGPPEMDDHHIIDENGIPLGAIAQEKSSFEYDYDFGDGWCHTVTVVSIEPAANDAVAPTVLAGEHACPPEDCGGPWGYADLLDALADPGHERHVQVSEWLDGEFDPELFDLDVANRAMPRPPRHDSWYR